MKGYGRATRQLSTAGAIEQTCWSLPFGDALSCVKTGLSTADDATEHHFTGKERDTESGNDYFGARYLSSNAGRWLTPDWSAKVAPVPYAKMGDPQSLNLYKYLDNNPLLNADVDGHCGPDFCVSSLISTVTSYLVTHPELARAANNFLSSVTLKIGVGGHTGGHAGGNANTSMGNLSPSVKNELYAHAFVKLSGSAGTSAGVEVGGGRAGNGAGMDSSLTSTISQNGNLQNPLTHLELSGDATIAGVNVAHIGTEEQEPGSTSLSFGYGEGFGGSVDLTYGNPELRDLISAGGEAIQQDFNNAINTVTSGFNAAQANAACGGSTDCAASQQVRQSTCNQITGACN